jgi:transketolase
MSSTTSIGTNWNVLAKRPGEEGTGLLDDLRQSTDRLTASGQSRGFDATEGRMRCKRHRRRILDISQLVTALHIAGAFSCTEIVDCIYHGLMRPSGTSAKSPDTFLLSKGHGCMIQYVVLEGLGVLSAADLDAYCTPHGRLGAHPDHGNPGIEASTGSLGHGLSMAVGMALAERGRGRDGVIYVVMSDGEAQEGSTWEAVLLASSLKLANIVTFIDNNDFQSLGRTSQTHPSFYPLAAKFEAFGWETAEVDGHDSSAIFQAVTGRVGDRPLMVVARTTKGKGTSYMENVPIWHYRSPNREEYLQAIAELENEP